MAKTELVQLRCLSGEDPRCSICKDTNPMYLEYAYIRSFQQFPNQRKVITELIMLREVRRATQSNKTVVMGDYSQSGINRSNATLKQGLELQFLNIIISSLLERSMMEHAGEQVRVMLASVTQQSCFVKLVELLIHGVMKFNLLGHNEAKLVQ